MVTYWITNLMVAMLSLRTKITAFLFLAAIISLRPLEAAELEYRVEFSGVQKPETLKLLKDASQLQTFQKKPLRSQLTLKRRAESDVPNLVKAMHSLAYYNAKIDLNIDFEATPIKITYHVNPGKVYPLAGYKVLPETLDIQPHQLGLCLNRPALPKDILDAEETLISVMTRKGYPLAQIKDREVVADQTSKAIFVTVQVESGPLAYFGETTITGNCSVRDSFIRRKIAWCEGSIYDPTKIDCTFNALDGAGVFSSININHAEEPNEDHSLPMTIQVSEGKPRSIGFGLIYSTQMQREEGITAKGGGFTAEWEHRNFRGMGEKVRFKMDILEYFQEATLMYIKPDFQCQGQDLLWIVDLEHDSPPRSFDKKSASLSGIIERQLNYRTRISYGGTYMYLRSDDSDNKGTYNLFKAPMQLKWTDTDDPLDPTCGNITFLKTVPTVEFLDSQFAYLITSLTSSFYAPVSSNKKFVLAAKINLGTILGASKRKIPDPERFYAGSENVMRGYKYNTVSPLDHKRRPLGGLSMAAFSLEGRWRASETWGGVVFYDFGNVYSDPIPKLNKKGVLRSVGAGIRYYTPVGPLRLDIAFPLDRRRKVDNAFQVYFSVGQAF